MMNDESAVSTMQGAALAEVCVELSTGVVA